MLLIDANVMIFDEATSAIDSETEDRLYAELFNVLRDKTVLIVAHRLSAVRQADHIYVFDGGRIAEQGKHTDLLDSDSLYKRLFEKQLAG